MKLHCASFIDEGLVDFNMESLGAEIVILVAVLVRSSS